MAWRHRNHNLWKDPFRNCWDNISIVWSMHHGHHGVFLLRISCESQSLRVISIEKLSIDSRILTCHGMAFSWLQSIISFRGISSWVRQSKVEMLYWSSGCVCYFPFNGVIIFISHHYVHVVKIRHHVHLDGFSSFGLLSPCRRHQNCYKERSQTILKIRIVLQIKCIPR